MCKLQCVFIKYYIICVFIKRRETDIFTIYNFFFSSRLIVEFERNGY